MAIPSLYAISNPSNLRVLDVIVAISTQYNADEFTRQDIQWGLTRLIQTGVLHRFTGLRTVRIELESQRGRTADKYLEMWNQELIHHLAKMQGVGPVVKTVITGPVVE